MCFREASSKRAELCLPSRLLSLIGAEAGPPPVRSLCERGRCGEMPVRVGRQGSGPPWHLVASNVRTVLVKRRSDAFRSLRCCPSCPAAQGGGVRGQDGVPLLCSSLWLRDYCPERGSTPTSSGKPPPREERVVALVRRPDPTETTKEGAKQRIVRKRRANSAPHPLGQVRPQRHWEGSHWAPSVCPVVSCRQPWPLHTLGLRFCSGPR